MAFPTTLTTDGLATRGVAGPYVSSTGNVYIIVVNDTQTDLRAFKATDPETSFSNIGTDVVINEGLIYAIAGYQVGDVLHIASKNGSGNDPVDIRYHVFDMSSDSWTTTNTLIKSNTHLAAAGFGYRCPIDIVVRSDGHRIIVYNGAVETVATTEYDRVYYARYQGAAWSADIALGTAGVAASWVGGAAILGPLDRIHFFLCDASNTDLYHQTLDSGYSLGSVGSAIDTAIEDPENSWSSRGRHVTATGVIAFPYYDSFQTINQASFTSTAAPTIVINTDITGARAALTSPKRFVASHAVDGNTLWLAFMDTSNDIYLQSKVGAGAWSTSTGFYTGSASAIFANVYTRGSALVMGMVMHDSGDPKYTEYTLSTIGAGSVLSSRMLLTGVGI